MPSFQRAGTKRSFTFDKEGNPTDWLVRNTQENSVCYNLVSIAQAVLNNPDLKLSMASAKGGRACTDGSNIFIPYEHPQRRIACKHELAHIYMKSNLSLRTLFVSDLISKVEKESGNAFGFSAKQRLLSDLSFFINILDDIRVNSLWGLLYPGDGFDMENWYYGNVGPEMFEEVQKEFGDDVPHLFTYAILLCLGQPAQSKEWGEFEGDIRQAADDVCFKSFPACLLVTRHLVMKIARRLAERQKEEQQPQDSQDAQPQDAQQDQADPFGGSPNPTERDENDPEYQKAKDDGGPTPNDDLSDLLKKRLEEKKEQKDDLQKQLEKMVASPPSRPIAPSQAGFDYDKSVKVEQDRLSAAILRALSKVETDEDLEKALQAQLEAGSELVQEIHQKMKEARPISTGGNVFKDDDNHLNKGIKATLNVRRISSSNIVPVHLEKEDLVAANKWKKLFLKVMGTMAMKTEEQGHEFLTDLYIQQKIAMEPYCCFRKDVTGRGFRVVILVDMSGSMAAHFHSVEKLAAVLAKSLDFPFVKLSVMGFNTTKAGHVNIYMFPKRTAGLISVETRATGLTPLSHAIQVAGRTLANLQDDSHVFVLSDGFPVYYLKDGTHKGTMQLMHWTREAVQELRRDNIKTWCWMIGSSTPDPKHMDRMFGHNNWKKITEAQIYQDSFDFIREKFLRYLRTR